VSRWRAPVVASADVIVGSLSLVEFYGVENIGVWIGDAACGSVLLASGDPARPVRRATVFGWLLVSAGWA